MKLNIVDKDARQLYAAMGISEERSDELALEMKEITKAMLEPDKRILLCEVMQQIAAICKTTEELVYAIDLNARWMAVKFGIELTSKRFNPWMK